MNTDNNTHEYYIRLKESESLMNTHEVRVSLETAKMLQKAGFDWKEYFVAHSIDEHFHWEIPLHIAQKWLREVKDIEICVDWEIEFEEKELDWNKRRYCYDIDTHVDNTPLLSIDDDYWAEGYHTFGDSYSTYEEALEAGINKCLTILLEEKK